jgi:6-phosphogluconolactonase
VDTGAGPSFLAFDPQRRWLVAVNEGGDAVESFAIAPDGTLTRVNAQSSMGAGPAHIAVDATGSWALVANYGGGTVAVLPVAADGTLGAAVDSAAAGANAHQIITNAANTVAYVPCKGADHIAVYAFDAGTGALTARPVVPAATGAGPRHIALHPSGDHAFVVNENNSTITSYAVQADGNLVPMETVSTLLSSFTGSNTGAEIAVHRSGAYVYASNRGHDSIVRYTFSPQQTLVDQQHVSVFGMQPRHFSFVYDDSAMLVAKQSSGSIHAFRIPADGVPIPVGEMATSPGPGFVGAIEVP